MTLIEELRLNRTIIRDLPGSDPVRVLVEGEKYSQSFRDDEDAIDFLNQLTLRKLVNA